MKNLVITLCMFSLVGCGIVSPLVRQESKLNSVDVGMSRPDVISKLGNPDNVKESKMNPDGRTERVDEYRLFKPGTSALNAVLGIPLLTVTWWTPYLGTKLWSPYWIEYVDGKVSRVLRDKDWNPELTADITVHQK